MRENLIKLDIFDVLAVTSYEAKHETGRHGRATIKAIIEEKREEEYVNAAKNTRWVRVDALDEADKESTIFYGLLEKICFFKESGSFLVELELITGSSLMEEKVHTRSFSKGSGEYTDILNILKEGYEEAHYITGEEGNDTVPDFLVQYRENDWNFIRRIAALKKTVVMPDYQSKGVKYFFGMPKRDTKVLTSQDVRIVVNKEYTVYEVKSREIHSLGDRVSFNRKDYRIVKIVSKTEGSELYHTYYLTQDIDYIVKKESKFDLKIIGASLYAKVTKVEKEKVKIAIEEIENKDEEIGRWFDFSTVYSSKDGAGWYCMPEKGDSVRLYFPTENEENAYVCSAIHENEGDGVRTDPENKIWRNKYGKEIRLTPDGIRISAGTGDYIELKDDEGVKIVSSGSIHIKAKDTLEISSEESNISIAAAKRIMLLQDGTQIILKDGISVSGDGVHIS